LLIIGGAGGVGSILIQLARKLTGLTVIATASRPETQQWCLDLGAHHVIDHRKPFAEQLRAIHSPEVEYVASLAATSAHYPGLIDVLAPQGHFGLIDDPRSLDAVPLKRKAASLHWEFMFTRSLFETQDMIAQHRLLNEVSELVDAGVIRTTFAESFGAINATNLKKAHALLESGRSRGKIVMKLRLEIIFVSAMSAIPRFLLTDAAGPVMVGALLPSRRVPLLCNFLRTFRLAVLVQRRSKTRTRPDHRPETT
jgi:NADPH:quinone reductase